MRIVTFKKKRKENNKANLNKDNLITLCQNCHNMTHNGRDVWKDIFQNLEKFNKELNDNYIFFKEGDLTRYILLLKGKSIDICQSEDMPLNLKCVYGKGNYFSIKNMKKKVYNPLKMLALEIGACYVFKSKTNTILEFNY